MEFNSPERMMLLAILPVNAPGTLAQLKIIHNLQMELSFSEQEMQDYEIKFGEDGQFAWSKAKDQPKEIELGEVAFRILLEEFKDRDAAATLQMMHIDLYERFLEEDKDRKDLFKED